MGAGTGFLWLSGVRTRIQSQDGARAMAWAPSAADWALRMAALPALAAGGLGVGAEGVATEGAVPTVQCSVPPDWNRTAA